MKAHFSKLSLFEAYPQLRNLRILIATSVHKMAEKNKICNTLACSFTKINKKMYRKN